MKKEVFYGCEGCFTENVRSKMKPLEVHRTYVVVEAFWKQLAYELAIKAEKVYEEANFTMEQKFAFLSKAVATSKEIQNVVIPRASSAFNELLSVLQAYDESCSRFHQ